MVSQGFPQARQTMVASVMPLKITRGSARQQMDRVMQG